MFWTAGLRSRPPVFFHSPFFHVQGLAWGLQAVHRNKWDLDEYGDALDFYDVILA